MSNPICINLPPQMNKRSCFGSKSSTKSPKTLFNTVDTTDSNMMSQRVYTRSKFQRGNWKERDEDMCTPSVRHH
jgi:hypothetical protein